MNKMINLVKNEYIKQYSKISIVIMTILLLAFSVVLPVFIKTVQSLNSTMYYYSYEEEYHSASSNLSNAIQKLNEEDKSDSLRMQFLLLKKDYVDFYMEHISDEPDWVMMLFSTYKEELVKSFVYQALSDGYTQNEIYDAESIYDIDTSWIVDDYSVLDSIFYTNYYSGNYSGNSQNEDIDYEKGKAEADEQKKLLREGILSGDYQFYNQMQFTLSQRNMENLKENIRQIQNGITSSPADSLLHTQLEEVQKEYDMEEEYLKIWQYRYDHEMAPDETGWQENTLNNIAYFQSTILFDDITPEHEYYDYYGTKPYEKYKQDIENYKEALDDNIQIMWHSLNNNIPLTEHIQSTRSLVGYASVYLWVIPIFILIIAAGLVSKEYSKGTIRLLLIRPVSRNKILASKLIMLFSLAIVLFVVCLGLHTISSGFCYGFSDLMVPALSIQNGQVVEGSFLLEFLEKFTLATISPIFTVLFVFFLSTVTKNTTISLTLGFLSLISFFPTLILAEVLERRAFWLAYTPLPYMDLYSALSSDIIAQHQSFGLTESIKTILGSHYNIAWGIFGLVILSLICLYLSFAIFKKRDIKN